MKRNLLFFTVLLYLTGVTFFAHSTDMSYLTEEYNRPGATVFTRLEVLETVRDANLTGIGEFYHSSLRGLLSRLPGLRTRDERVAAESAAIILARGLAAERYIDAAPDLWSLAQSFDVIRDINDGLVMQEALRAMGQIGASGFVTHIALRLDAFNVAQTPDSATRVRVERAVVGAINALEALRLPEGFRPVFFASIGWYDIFVRTTASVALPNIMEDPEQIISEIIRDPSSIPRVKYEALREMLRTRAPNSSKAKAAAVALATGWTYTTNNLEQQRFLKDLRLSAINTIRVMGAADDSVYANLGRSYSNNFGIVAPDYDEIRATLETLSALRSENGANLLLGFLRDLNGRRRNGPWGARERQILQMLIPALGASGIQSLEARQLLTSIQGSSDYTSMEQSWARDALRAISQ